MHLFQSNQLFYHHHSQKPNANRLFYRSFYSCRLPKFCICPFCSQLVTFAWVHSLQLHLALHSSFLSLRRKRSEEHTSELQSRPHLVCRLLLEKKKLKHI